MSPESYSGFLFSEGFGLEKLDELFEIGVVIIDSGMFFSVKNCCCGV